MKLFKHSIIAICSLVTIMSCDKKDTVKKETATYEKKGNPVQKLDTSTAIIRITGSDAMQFNKKVIKIKSGQKVKLTLKHIGNLDINIMGHNFVLLKKNVDLADFASKAMKAKENEYIPTDSKDIIAHTKLIGKGETTTIEFDAPEKGTYQFLCSFPGHYGMMKGKFIVE
jgi:azurin